MLHCLWGCGFSCISINSLPCTKHQASTSCFTFPATWPAVWTYKRHGPSPPLELMQLETVSCESLMSPACFVGPRSSRDAPELWGHQEAIGGETQFLSRALQCPDLHCDSSDSVALGMQCVIGSVTWHWGSLWWDSRAHTCAMWADAPPTLSMPGLRS